LRRAATGVVALQLALFVALGIPDGALGVAWPTMRGSLGRPLGDFGIVLAAQVAGYLVAGPSTARLVRRIGTATAMIGASALATVAVGMWTFTHSWVVVIVAAVGLGLSRGTVDAGLNSYVALHGGVRRLGLLHASYGVGTSVGPLIVVASLAAGSWRYAFGALAVIDGLVTWWALRRRHAWAADEATPVGQTAGTFEPRPSPWAVPVTLALFGALVGAEYTTGAWSYTLLTDGRGVGDTAAGLWVAAYWFGLTAGRFALGLRGDRVSRLALLDAAWAVSLAAVMFLWWDPGGMGALALPIAGAGFSVLFPTLIALVPDRMGRHRSAHVIGWSVAVGSAGGAAVAALAGVLADNVGPLVLAPTFVVVTAVGAGLHLLLAVLAPTPPHSGSRRRWARVSGSALGPNGETSVERAPHTLQRTPMTMASSAGSLGPSNR
jgi:fucose permease